MHGVPSEPQLVPTLVLGPHQVTLCTENSRTSLLDLLQLQQCFQDALAAESTRIHERTPALLQQSSQGSICTESLVKGTQDMLN